jgi:hypothetical protein
MAEATCMQRARIVFSSGMIAAMANQPMYVADTRPLYRLSIYRIYICANTSGVLYVVRNNQIQEALNGGSPLNANAAYTFDILVEADEQIDLVYSATATIITLKIIEIPFDVVETQYITPFVCAPAPQTR